MNRTEQIIILRRNCGLFSIISFGWALWHYANHSVPSTDATISWIYTVPPLVYHNTRKQKTHPRRFYQVSLMEEQLQIAGVLCDLHTPFLCVIVRKLHVYGGRQHHRSDTIILISLLSIDVRLKLTTYVPTLHGKMQLWRFVPT